MAIHHFIAGGAAAGHFDALDETVQVVFEELSSGHRKLRYAAFHNPGAATATVKLFWKRQRQNLTFGGTATDGDYVSTFFHPSLPAVGVPVTTPRSTTPANNAALAVQHEADIESESALSALIASANDDGVDTCNVLTTLGVRDLVITTSAPSPGTLTNDSTVVPILASDVPDLTITIAAGATVPAFLGDESVFRLYAAATAESGVGDTAPNADITGFLVTG